MQRRADRSRFELWLAFSLLAAGSALWLTSVLRNPAALQMLPALDGCMATGILGALLALLHGVPYRVTIFGVMAPVLLIQAIVCALLRASFVPMLGVEMAVLGLLGVVSNRSAAPSRAADAKAKAEKKAEEKPAPEGEEERSAVEAAGS